MEILERGEPGKIWPREFVCPHCTSKLLLELADVKRNTDYLGDFSSWYIDCPVCLDQPDVPKEWWPVLDRCYRNPKWAEAHS